MILGNPTNVSSAASRVTIDELFRRAATRRPDALALVDPPNRSHFAHGAPRQLTFREADRMVSAIAGKLRRMALPTDSIIGIQLPNLVENVLTFLGVLRAGMVAAPIPLLWRPAEARAAFGGIDLAAIVTCARVGDVDHAELAMNMAADIFPVRYVCAFGPNLPDGIVPFDDLFHTHMPGPLPVPEGERFANSAAHVAVLTWDVTSSGLAPVARTQIEMIAAGIYVVLEGEIANDATILSTLTPCSFAGLSLTLVPWLVTGGTLTLHHPFDPDVLTSQCDAHHCNAIMLPASLAFRLADGRRFRSRNGLWSVFALWRSPERMASSPFWTEHGVSLVDIQAFGETGILASRRAADGRPVSLHFGPITAPRGAAAGVPVIEVARTGHDTVALRGPMVPHHPFPMHATPVSQADGLVDTGFACREDLRSVVVTAPPSGIVGVGGYHFALSGLQECVNTIDDRATVEAVADPLLGHRLMVRTAVPERVRNGLTAHGVCPLVSDALPVRSGKTADAA